MKNSNLQKLFLLLVFSCFVVNASAQEIPAEKEAMKIKAYRFPSLRDYNTWDVGAHIGFTYPSTDIAGSKIGFGSKQMAFGVDVTKFFSHIFAAQFRAIYGGLEGIDDEKDLFQFKTTINYDLTLNAVFQFGNISFISRKKELAIYATIGAGVINYTPKVSIDGGKTEYDGIYSQYTQPYEFPDYKSTSDLVVPVGIGLKYHATPKLSITGEYSLRTTQSDKLDGFFKLLSAEDHYSSLNFGVVYHLGRQSKSIEWANPMKSLYDEYFSMKEKVDNMGIDNDNDGVVDLFDREPDTRAGSKVYGDGRSVDTDGDGIPDISDSDPYSNMKAKVDATGQSLDNVATKPVEPGNAAPVEAVKKLAPVDEEARLRDSDQDGVPDYLDAEPYSIRGARVDADGKEFPADAAARKKDGDNDGVPDFLDLDPFTSKGVVVDAYGREIPPVEIKKAPEVMKVPSEGITVVKSEPVAPAPTPVPPPVPETQVSTTPVSKTVSNGTPSNFDLPTIYFETDQDVISKKYFDDLSSFALLMHNKPGLTFRVIGNCDTKGSVSYNIELGKRRAEAVKNYLVKNFKADPKRLFTETSGKENVIQGVGYINRRVDIKIKD